LPLPNVGQQQWTLGKIQVAPIDAHIAEARQNWTLQNHSLLLDFVLPLETWMHA